MLFSVISKAWLRGAQITVWNEGPLSTLLHSSLVADPRAHILDYSEILIHLLAHLSGRESCWHCFQTENGFPLQNATVTSIQVVPLDQMSGSWRAALWTVHAFSVPGSGSQLHTWLMSLLFLFFLPSSCSIEIREQCYEYQAVQLLPSSVLASELHGCVYLVLAVCWGEGYVCELLLFIKTAKLFPSHCACGLVYFKGQE